MGLSPQWGPLHAPMRPLSNNSIRVSRLSQMLLLAIASYSSQGSKMCIRQSTWGTVWLILLEMSLVPDLLPDALQVPWPQRTLQYLHTRHTINYRIVTTLLLDPMHQVLSPLVLVTMNQFNTNSHQSQCTRRLYRND